MAIGYYEHEIEVRFTEGIMSSSNDWQWFVDYTEKQFNPVIALTNMSDFNNCYFSISQVYVHFSKISESSEVLSIDITAAWLSRLYECIQVKTGAIELESAIKGDGFFDVLAIMSYSTFLMNRVSESKYLFNPQLLFIANLHELYDFDPLGNLKSHFLEIVSNISLDNFDKAVQTLDDNFSSNSKPIDNEYVDALLDRHFHADFLSFQTVESHEFQTWQESLLCDVFKTSCTGGVIEPTFRLRDGTENPDTSFWTEEILKKAKASFDDPRAVCVIETIEFLKHEIAPSEETQKMLVTLCLTHARECVVPNRPPRAILCTAFHVVQQLSERRMLNSKQKERYFKEMRNIFEDISDPNVISFMQEHSIPCTKAQKDLHQKRIQRIAKESLDAVKSPYDLQSVFRNEQIARACDSDDIELSVRLFRQMIEEDGILAADLFYWALQFYIEAMGNPLVDNNRIRNILINLRHSWQNEYYKSTISNMQVITQEGSISVEEINQLNTEFLVHPSSLAHATIVQSDDAIADTLESMTEHAVLYLFGKTTISEYYPEHIHISFDAEGYPIDHLITKEIIRVYDEKSYRFINSLPEQEVIDGFYDGIKDRIGFIASLINIEPAYGWITDNIVSPYELLPFPDNRPALGHVMQFFPMLENVIRGIGEFFNIVPFQIDKMKFTRLREVSRIIYELVEALESITNTIQGSNEFLFVYHVMYSPNGFNIRNECVHGRRYQGPDGVSEAFRLTVICTYMMLKRLRGLELAQNKEDGEDAK